MKRSKRIAVLLLALLMVLGTGATGASAVAAGSGSYVTGDDNYRQPVPEC